MPVTKSAKTQLEKMKSLLQRKWIRGWMAQTADGKPISPTDPHAAAWTVTGAFVAAYDPMELDDEENWVWGRLVAFAGMRSINQWNDAPERTQKEVVALIDKVIEALDEELSNRPKKPRKTRAKSTEVELPPQQTV